jgi:hypothetical protein
MNSKRSQKRQGRMGPRKAILKKRPSYTDPHHSDEIYTGLNSIRK